ncbi:ECF-type riboflavin transporter substrate-binding protein ['Fragaria x ananassa' phyllody phytoplasma]|uniref:ECF-type riboflavin transporter substrate-binding protein n=1 Tax='Fragaria x ananassa' phyllody phytoplasma TaxID=2358428 RepID=A0ABS5K346_9MOLU|nr:ECF-type riboflavin transporter substrate-binding protein ['Fragaria x ananassa' phyllody phytoplasma]MBS2126129.1 ECF-type riboflavin transporter substrate-binding protein ['Fragaria x ananassa' phyllody phytoplasma]
MKQDNAIKKTVTIAINAAIFVILSCLASIPIAPNVDIETASPFLAFVSVLFGPFVGFYVGIIGHTIKDFIVFGNVFWNWIICSGVIGFLYGLLQKIINLKYKPLNKKKIVGFWFYQVLVNFSVWGFLAPISDLWIYHQPWQLVFFQGFLIVIINIIACSFIGIPLMLCYNHHHTHITL